MTITVSAFLIVLILGIVAIVYNIAKESPNSTFWFLASFWVCCLAHLYPGLVIR